MYNNFESLERDYKKYNAVDFDYEEFSNVFTECYYKHFSKIHITFDEKFPIRMNGCGIESIDLKLNCKFSVFVEAILTFNENPSILYEVGVYKLLHGGQIFNENKIQKLITYYKMNQIQEKCDRHNEIISNLMNYKGKLNF